MNLKAEIHKPIFKPATANVFRDLAVGLSCAEIAKSQHRSEETIKWHAKIIRETFGANSIGKAVAIAVARGIITITEAGGKSILLALLIAGSDVSADLIKIKTKPTVVRTVRVRNQL